MNKLPKNFIADPFSYHEEVLVEIVDITNLGYGVGRIAGWVVMVPYVCVGELALARIYKNFKNYSVGDLVRVERPSMWRVTPKCELFGVCGGCQYQHMNYQQQVKNKHKQVEALLNRIGGVDCHVNECICSPREYGYRSKITPHFQKKIPPLGFLRHGSKQLVDVKNCPLASDAINAALLRAREELLQSSHTRKKGGTLLFRDIGYEIVTNPRAIVTQTIDDFTFSSYAGEFFQNNPYVLPSMVSFVVGQAVGTKYLVDAYCGVGIFGIMAAKYFYQVIGVEISETAIRLANRNADDNNINNVKFLPGTAERIFDNIAFPCGDTTIIIDPPRAGCSQQFLCQLIKFSPQKIVYVSCSPDTLARDVKFLSDKYHISLVQPIDMFPQTRHIESVVVLNKN